MALNTAAYNSQQLIAPSPRIGGSVWKAPIGTAIPTSSFATLAPVYIDNGYTDDKGIGNKETRRNTQVFAWGGGLLGTLQQSYMRQYSFNLMQLLNADVLGTVFGQNNVFSTPATSSQGHEFGVALNSNLLDTMTHVFDGIYQNQYLLRVAVPNGRVVTVGDMDFTNTKFSSAPCQMDCFPDTSNNFAYLYLNNGLTTTAGGS
jgi:hypothetical protein